MAIGRGLVLLVGAALVASGCHYFERYKSCRDVRIDIVNSEQTTGAVSITAQDEVLFAPQTVLQSGEARRIVLCLDRGDTVRFRAGLNGEEIGVARCTVNQASYEATTVKVVWTLQGFFCQGW